MASLTSLLSSVVSPGRALAILVGVAAKKDPDELDQHGRTAKPSEIQAPESYDFSRLVSSADGAQTKPIHYVYDPVPDIPLYLHPRVIDRVSYAERVNFPMNQNALQLNPIAAGLPYRSSFASVCSNKHFGAIIEETTQVLRLLANHGSALDVEVGHGITVARIAEKELRPGIEDRLLLATTHMFPCADEVKARQIACLMILYFVFDDKVEETPDSTLHTFREGFFGHLEVQSSANPQTGPLQDHIDSVIRGIEEADRVSGNGGEEMLVALRGAFKKVHPSGEFRNLREYLDFRRLNVGALFVVAAAKFSIGSSVDSSSPAFAVLLRLSGDHLGIVNDIGSYEKELRALEAGDTEDMINIVAVIKNLMSLPDTASAKSVAYAYQLQVERWIWEETERLSKTGLSDEEWWFIEAVLLAASGNVFYYMVASRYGGEKARIRN